MPTDRSDVLTLLAPRDLSTRNNSLNMLRLVFALLVALSHAQLFTISGDGVVIFGQHLGSWAIVGFLGISGYLITGARIRSDADLYLINRVVRIFPVFVFVLIFVAFFLASLTMYIESGTIDGYFGTSPTPLDYVYSNLLLKVSYYHIGTTLSTHPLNAWNGSLWSLSYKFWRYIITGVFMSWKSIRERVWPTTGLFVLFILAYMGIAQLRPYIGNNYDLELLIFMTPYFMGGTMVYQLRDRLPICHLYALTMAVISLLLVWYFPAFGRQLVSPTMAYLVLYFGSILLSPGFTRVHDISYGVYIFHFPIIQFLIALKVHLLGFWPFLFIILLVTCALATVSWSGIGRAAMCWVRGRNPWGDIRKPTH